MFKYYKRLIMKKHAEFIKAYIIKNSSQLLITYICPVYLSYPATITLGVIYSCYF